MPSLPTRTLRRAVRAMQRRRTFAQCLALPPGGRLHVGCGPAKLEGWINVDKFPSPATDYVIDIRYGLPFLNLSFIFAEHFLEHLSYDEAVTFLENCRAALAPAGVLRLSTPNLDWVHAMQYHPGQWGSASEAVRDCFSLNMAFRGWGHQFLFNLPTLTATLHKAGFASVQPSTYGNSDRPELRNLEKHQPFPDTPELPHVLVIEASGIAAPSDPSLPGLADFRGATAAR